MGIDSTNAPQGLLSTEPAGRREIRLANVPLVLSLLVLKLGPGAVDVVAHHGLAALAVVGGVAVIGFGWWWMRKKRTSKLEVD